MTSMTHRARQVAERVVRGAGFDVLRYSTSTRTPVVMDRVSLLAGTVRTVVDVGASNGMWTRTLLAGPYPHPDFLLFEANPAWHDDLRSFAAEHSKVRAEYVAASDHEGEIFFHVDPANPLGGGAAAQEDAGHTASLPCLPVDAAVERHGLDGPFLLKLDTQGHEIQVLAGAERVLKEASLVIIEVYGIGNDGQPPIDELLGHMRGYGFRLAGLADVMTRPADGIFWQADAYFLPEANPAFRDHAYH